MANRREKECNWIEHEFNKNKTTSIVLYECILQENLDISKMNDAWEYVVREHEGLTKTIRMEQTKISSVFMAANQPMGESHKKIEYLKNVDIPRYLELITNQDDEITMKAVPFRLWFVINKDTLWICLKLPRSMADNKSMQIIVNDLLQHYDKADSHQGTSVKNTYEGKIFGTQDVKIETHDARKQQLKHFHGGLSIPVSRGENYKMTDPCGVLTASIRLHEGYKNPTERKNLICKAMIASIFGMCEMRSVNKNSISPRLPLLDFEVDFDYRRLHGTLGSEISYENTMGNFSFDINCFIKQEQKTQKASKIQAYLWDEFFEEDQNEMMTLESRIFQEYPAKRETHRELNGTFSNVRRENQGFTRSVAFSFNFIEETELKARYGRTHKLCDVQNVYFAGGHHTPLRAAYIVNFTFIGKRASLSVLYPRTKSTNNNYDVADNICRNIQDAFDYLENQSDFSYATLDEFKRQQSQRRSTHV